GPELAAIGVASMAETGAVLDRAGDALTELIRWDSGHGSAGAAALAEDAATLFAATGGRVSPKMPLAGWSELRRQRPAIAARWHRWLGAADLVVHALTGAAVADHTLAGRTGGYLLPSEDAGLADHLDAALLARAGLSPEQLPSVAAPDGVAARLARPA